MRATHAPVAIAAAVAALTIAPAHAGPLTPPPGPPADTNTLTLEADARIPINTLPGAATTLHLITQPGSYYLTANLIATNPGNMIRVAADNVTIDLNDFTIDATNGAGILTNNNRTTIRNGTITSAATTAILIDGGDDHVVEDLRLQDNNFAIARATPTTNIDFNTIRRVLFEDNTQSIILPGGARIEDCRFSGLFSTHLSLGDASAIRRCTFIGGGNGITIAAGDESIVQDVVIFGTSGNAIVLEDEAVIENIVIYRTQTNGPFAGHGITAGDRATIHNAIVIEPAADGIRVGGDARITSSRVEGAGGIGFQIGTGSSVTHCIAQNCTTNGFQTTNQGPTGIPSTIEHCAAIGNAIDGFSLGFPATIRHCVANGNGDDGFQITGGTEITHSRAQVNGFGFFFSQALTDPPYPARFRIDSSAAEDNFSAQYSVSNGAGIITRNVARGPNAYVIGTGSIAGQIISAPATLSGSTDPFANFAY